MPSYLRRDEDVVVHHVVEADVGGVAVVAGEEDVLRFRFRLDEFGEGEEGDAVPLHVEFAPGGDAVEIADVFELREGVEFFPREGLRMLDRAADFEAPFGERDLGFDPEIEDGKAGGEMLAGREAIRRSGRWVSLSRSSCGRSVLCARCSWAWCRSRGECIRRFRR